MDPVDTFSRETTVFEIGQSSPTQAPNTAIGNTVELREEVDDQAHFLQSLRIANEDQRKQITVLQNRLQELEISGRDMTEKIEELRTKNEQLLAKMKQLVSGYWLER